MKPELLKNITGDEEMKVWDDEGEEENADLRFLSLPADGSVNSTIFKN